jgi:uncharacterized membrane protein
VITPASAQRILRRYGQVLPEAEREIRAAGRGRTATIFGSFGALLVGLGVILFVASNWEEMGRALKLTLLTGGLVLSAGIAFFLRERGHPRIGAAMVFVTALVYAANVFLVGQMYHASVSDPVIPFLVGIGVLPLAFVAASRLAMFVSIMAFLLWYSTLVNSWGATFGPHPLLAPTYLAIGIAAVSAGRIMESFAPARPLALVTALVGLVVAVLTIFVLTFTWVWEQAGRSFVSARTETADAFVASVAVICALAVAITVGGMWRRGWSRAALVEALGLLGLGAITILTTALHPFGEAGTYAVLFNILAVLVALWAVLVGISTGRESFINVGLALFGLVVFARYVDYFGTLFDRSLAFIGAGILLLLGGYALERSRRVLLARARQAGATDA